MGRTIIQPIGPLYGEAVNGTVFGRPNGSIFVPDTNKIKLSLISEYITNYTIGASTWVYCSNAGGTPISKGVEISADSQDTANYMSIQIAEDSDFTQNVSTSNLTAGLFNQVFNSITGTSGYTLTKGSTYYIRAVLFAASNVAVATSDVIEVTAV